MDPSKQTQGYVTPSYVDKLDYDSQSLRNCIIDYGFAEGLDAAPERLQTIIDIVGELSEIVENAAVPASLPHKEPTPPHQNVALDGSKTAPVPLDARSVPKSGLIIGQRTSNASIPPSEGVVTRAQCTGRRMVTDIFEDDPELREINDTRSKQKPLAYHMLSRELGDANWHSTIVGAIGTKISTDKWASVLHLVHPRLTSASEIARVLKTLTDYVRGPDFIKHPSVGDHGDPVEEYARILAKPAGAARLAIAAHDVRLRSVAGNSMVRLILRYRYLHEMQLAYSAMFAEAEDEGSDMAKWILNHPLKGSSGRTRTANVNQYYIELVENRQPYTTKKGDKLLSKLAENILIARRVGHLVSAFGLGYLLFLAIGKHGHNQVIHDTTTAAFEALSSAMARDHPTMRTIFDRFYTDYLAHVVSGRLPPRRLAFEDADPAALLGMSFEELFAQSGPNLDIPSDADDDNAPGADDDEKSHDASNEKLSLEPQNDSLLGDQQTEGDLPTKQVDDAQASDKPSSRKQSNADPLGGGDGTGHGIDEYSAGEMPPILDERERATRFLFSGRARRASSASTVESGLTEGQMQGRRVRDVTSGPFIIETYSSSEE